MMMAFGVLMPSRGSAQAPPRYNPPRLADGKPDMNGIWQAMSTASFDLQDHPGQLGIPPGKGVIDAPEIPYQPAALATKKANFQKRMTADPLRQCLLPGVPRATYLPYPFEITQGPKLIGFTYQFVHAVRIVPSDATPHSPTLAAGFDSWMGDSRFKWDGDTLVIDVVGLNDQTWFDEAGNFHSEALHVVERYTRTGPDHLMYEATIEDPKTFTRPWKITMPLYRHVEKGAEILPYDCFIYLQDAQFGPRSN
jgi:hypothetical protein